MTTSNFYLCTPKEQQCVMLSTLLSAHAAGCSQRLTEAFLPWSSLSRDCKRALHSHNKRWHDRAMQLEKEDAHRVCSPFPNDYSLEDVNALLDDLKEDVHRNSDACPYPYFRSPFPPPPPS